MLELQAQIREIIGSKVNSLRRAGFVPAVLYRKGKANVNLQVTFSDFKKIFREAGESSVVKLKIEGDSEKIKNKERTVLVHDTAKDPVTGDVTHIDFYEVRMDEKTTASVPLVFVGEAPAVKAGGGTLIKSINEVEVEALVRDLPRQIEIDITGLLTFDDLIHVKDLKIPAGVKLLAKEDDVVVLVAPPRKEEEVAPTEGAAAEEAKEGEEAPAGTEVAEEKKE